MFRRRKLDKDIKKYVRETTGVLRWAEFDRIGRDHGFQCVDMGVQLTFDG